MISSFFGNNNSSNKKLNDIDEHKLLASDDNKRNNSIDKNTLIYNDVYIINSQFQNENETNFSNYEKLRLKLTPSHLILQTKNLKFLINNDPTNANDNSISEYQQFAFANSILQCENDERVSD